MNITNFSIQQREALLDLLVLAMYADGHLDLVEDTQLERLLAAMGFETDYDRQKQLDASVTRIRQYSVSAELARSHAVQLAKNFSAAEERAEVCRLLEQQINSDNKVAPAEHQLLSAIRASFGL
jgi:uncharacterized tellurite resistance protein B-like protein